MVKVTFQTDYKVSLIKAVRNAFYDAYGTVLGMKEAKDAVEQGIVLEDNWQQEQFFHKIIPGIMSHFCTVPYNTAFDSNGNATTTVAPTWSYKVEEYAPAHPMTLNDMIR